MVEYNSKRIGLRRGETEIKTLAEAGQDAKELFFRGKVGLMRSNADLG
jgi:hypothetical protein